MTRVTLDCGEEKRALRVLENNNTLPASPCPSSTSTTTPNCSPSPPFFNVENNKEKQGGHGLRYSQPAPVATLNPNPATPGHIS